MAKIYIDQGHNPQNPNAGAEANGYREQDLVYTIGVETAALLREAGQEVRLSRPTPDTQLGTSNASSLAARVNEANAWGADLFVSLHANASSLESAEGSEAYVFRRGGVAEALAEDILRELSFSTGIGSRGVFVRPTLYVLRRTQMPATLIELGFITNPAEAALMANEPFLYASGVANGILDYLFGS
ncbi:MAG: N-acetylmuramoyl-L-alanine amidase [Clostridia bacterium]|nr:N-acetylmuramoyl-L-alanine amidase [Clostridia bacterium]